MPSKIYIFKSVNDAVDKLGKYYQGFDFSSILIEETSEGIVKNAVTSNIFRALSNSKTQPSEIFREWALDHFNTINKSLGKIKSQKEYDNLIFFLANSLINEWEGKAQVTSDKIGFGPAIKIINLLVKRIQESNSFTRPNIWKYMHVPFDKYSLLPLKNIINDLTGLKYKLPIQKNVSMGYVTNMELYIDLTKVIGNLSKRAKIQPITYDY